MNKCKNCVHYAPVEDKYMWNERRKKDYGNKGSCQHISDKDAIRVYSDSVPVMVDGDWGCALWSNSEN